VRSVVMLLMLAPAVLAAPPSTCALPGAYESALCAYQHRDFATAEKQFRTILDLDERDPATIRAAYFLARTLMKTGRFEEAAGLFIKIHGLDKSFYDTWNCDFLLGECRRAMGK
jgi:TolA-binding protein